MEIMLDIRAFKIHQRMIIIMFVFIFRSCLCSTHTHCCLHPSALCVCLSPVFFLIKHIYFWFLFTSRIRASELPGKILHLQTSRRGTSTSETEAAPLVWQTHVQRLSDVYVMEQQSVWGQNLSKVCGCFFIIYEGDKDSGITDTWLPLKHTHARTLKKSVLLGCDKTLNGDSHMDKFYSSFTHLEWDRTFVNHKKK